MARPFRDDEPLDHRIPVQVSKSESAALEAVAGKGNKSDFARRAIKRALAPIPILGSVCCGKALEAMFDEPLAQISYVADLLPRTQGETYYFLWADGDSMNRPGNPRLDIQNDDLLPFVRRDDAQNREIVHYEIADDWGDHICGVRMYNCDPETGIVTLRASNNAMMSDGSPLHPDIVRPRDEVIVRGMWLRVSIRGVPH